MYRNLSQSYSRLDSESAYKDTHAIDFYSPYNSSHTYLFNDSRGPYRSPERRYRGHKSNDFPSLSSRVSSHKLSNTVGRDGFQFRTKSPRSFDLDSQLKSELRSIRFTPNKHRASSFINADNFTDQHAERNGDYMNETYSHEYVQQLKARHYNELREVEEKYRLLSREYEDFKMQMTENITSLNRQLEKESSRHASALQQTKRDADFNAEKILKNYEYEILLLTDKLKTQEEQVDSLKKKLKYADTENINQDHETKNLINNLKIQIQKIEIDRERERNELQNHIQVIVYDHDKEKRRLKESHERLVSELSTEIKEIYRKMDEEMHLNEERVIELERKISHTQRDSKRDIYVVVELDELAKSNNFLKRSLEESKLEVLKLSASLDDKKNQIHFLESKIDLMKPERLSHGDERSQLNTRRSLYST